MVCVAKPGHALWKNLRAAGQDEPIVRERVTARVNRACGYIYGIHYTLGHLDAPVDQATNGAGGNSRVLPVQGEIEKTGLVEMLTRRVYDLDFGFPGSQPADEAIRNDRSGYTASQNQYSSRHPVPSAPAGPRVALRPWGPLSRIGNASAKEAGGKQVAEGVAGRTRGDSGPAATCAGLSSMRTGLVDTPGMRYGRCVNTRRDHPAGTPGPRSIACHTTYVTLALPKRAFGASPGPSVRCRC